MTYSGSSSRPWRFFRAGGFDQVKLETGADLMALDQLDLKLWVALACPTTGLEFDHATLALIDTDHDGRVRAPELIAAVKWVGSLLKNPDDLIGGNAELGLSAINDSTAEGKSIANFARQVLSKAEADSISIDEAAAAAKTFAAKPFNGDGVVPAESTEEEAMKVLINEMIACLGADTDTSGKPGISQAKIDQFFTEAVAYSDWWKKAEGDKNVLPLGLGTAAATMAVNAAKTKVEDYFARCQFAAFDPRSVNALNHDEKDFLALASKELTANATELRAFPLARVSAGNPLPLVQGINPAWADVVEALARDAVKPLLGDRTTLSESDWKALLGKLAPYEAWSSTKSGGAVEKLGLERVREILSGKGKETLTALIAKDKEEEANAKAVDCLHRLVRYHRDLNRLCNNFVSFRDFYGRKEKAIFQSGTLYLDQRSCDLCLTVEDAGKHATMAALAGTYLAYCDCFRKGTGEKMQIVAAFTGGDSDNLMVGRNGIFFDRKGRDWDATISKIIDNPISVRQAFFAPYKKLVRLIEEQVAKRAAAADAASDAKLAAAAQTTAGVPPPPPPPKPVEPPKQKVDTGTLAAIGLVLTTLLAALGGIFGKIAGLPTWEIPLAILAIIILISTPSMVIAYLKLRRRNLGPILDANGWAVNAKARMNVPFGGSLTAVATLPPGAQRDMADPFAEKKSSWPAVIVLLILALLAVAALNKMGYLYEWTGGRIGEPRNAPAQTAPPSAAAPTQGPAQPAEAPK